MYYCYIKKSLLSLIILFFMHSLIYASFPIEDINENAINSFFSEDNKDDDEMVVTCINQTHIKLTIIANNQKTNK